MSESHWDVSSDVEFTAIPSGEKLTKFVARDEAVEHGDFTVELHGFYREDGTFIFTNQIIKKRES